uniref:Galactose-3-O-sulfotransferase 3 n=1 Tax=Latimeria chalumnae TaxID=7897 RepID=H3ALZ5_LATCH
YDPLLGHFTKDPSKMSRKKLLLVVLVLASLSLIVHHNWHLNWYTKSMQACYHPKSSREKHTAVVFLKTHKTASSTVQNVLFRFAEKHNVTVALPVQSCYHQFCYPRNFTARFIHPYSTPPRVITSHMRFNFSEVKKIMPNDTIYFTILRDPVSMFESLFSYYNQYCLSFKYVPNHSITTFLNNPLKYYKVTEKYAMYSHNTLTFDLGGDKDHNPEDEEYVSSFIKEMEDIFSLVMIAEYFDESLVLLKHLLSWDLEDILYIKLNMRSEESKLNITSDIPRKVREWNALDTKLYDHFNATLWKKLYKFGVDCVGKEVQLLRQAQKKLVENCFGGHPQVRLAKNIKNKELRPWQPSSKVNIIGYELPMNVASRFSDYCRKLVMPEVQYTKYLLRKETLR